MLVPTYEFLRYFVTCLRMRRHLCSWRCSWKPTPGRRAYSWAFDDFDVLHVSGTTAIAAAFASSSDEMRAVSTAAGQVGAARLWMICCCLARL